MLKNIFCLLFCLVSVCLQAQEKNNKAIQWGFSLGIETQSLLLESLYDDISPEEAWIETDRNKPGMTLGVLMQKNIWKGLSFQSGLSLSHTQNRLVFHPDGPQKYQFTDLEVPLYLMVTNQNSKLPLRAKVLIGPRLGWNLAKNSSENLQFLQERLAMDIGLGVEIKFGKWNICPEAIFSLGLNNIHDFTSTKYDFLIGKSIRDKLAFRVVMQRAHL